MSLALVSWIRRFESLRIVDQGKTGNFMEGSRDSLNPSPLDESMLCAMNRNVPLFFSTSSS